MLNTKDYPFYYEKTSRQNINVSKSSIFFTSKNMVAARKCELVHELGVRVCDGSGKYLGLPFLIGRTKKRDICILTRSYMEEDSWVEQKGVRKYSSVLQAIPTYDMFVYKLPLTLCKDLEAIIRSFWWKSNFDGKGMAWVAWNRVCRPESLEVWDLNIYLLLTMPC